MAFFSDVGMAVDYKDCIRWFQAIQFPTMSDHPIFSPSVNQTDFFKFIRDGSTLCFLLNHIDVRSVSLVCVSSNCENSEQRCLRNATVFLNACLSYYKLKPSDLFSAEQLYSGEGIQQVVFTLQALSHSPVYGSAMLETRRRPHRLEKGSNTVVVHNEYDQYECYDKSRVNSDLTVDNQVSPDENVYRKIVDNYVTPPLTYVTMSSDHIRNPTVRECVDKEKVYASLISDVIQLYKKQLTSNELLAEHFTDIFCGTLFEDMKKLHEDIIAEVCSLRFPTETEALCKAFQIHRKSLAHIYGKYFAEIDNSNQQLESILEQNPFFRDTFDRIRQEADPSSPCSEFPLSTVLKMPYQNVLKYYLFIERIKEEQVKTGEVEPCVEITYDLLRDVNTHLNECKRDVESLRLVESVLGPVDPDIRLDPKRYGKLLIESEFVKIKLGNEFWSKVRIYLFQMCLVCVSNNNKFMKFPGNNCAIEVKTVGQNSKYIIKLIYQNYKLEIPFKTQFQCTEWQKKLEQATRNNSFRYGHKLELTSFEEATDCNCCRNLLKGYYCQGYKCEKCAGTFHIACVQNIKEECKTVPVETSRNPSSLLSSPVTPTPATLTLPMSLHDSLPNGHQNQHRRLSVDQNLFLNTLPRQASKLPDDPLADQDWFCPFSNRETSFRICSQLPAGTFLVRRSENDRNGAAILIQFNGEIQTIKIYKDLRVGKFHVAREQKFDSIPNLISYFQRQSLENFFPQIKTKLITPFKTGLRQLQDSLDPSKYASLAFLTGPYTANVGSDDICRLQIGELVKVKTTQSGDPTKTFVEALVESGSGSYKIVQILVPVTILDATYYLLTT